MIGTTFLGLGAKPQAALQVKQLFAPALRFFAPVLVADGQLALEGVAHAFEDRMDRIWPAMLQWPAPEDVDDAWRMWVARVAFNARADDVDDVDEHNNGREDDGIEVPGDDDGSDGETTLVDDEAHIKNLGLTHSASFDDTLLCAKALLVSAVSTEDIDAGSALENDAQALVFPTLNIGSQTFIGKETGLRADAPAFVPKAAAGPPALRADAPVFVPKGPRSPLRAAAPVFVPYAG